MLIRIVALSVTLAALTALLPDSRASHRLAGRNDDFLARLYAVVPIGLLVAIAWSCLQLAKSRGLWLDEYGTLWVVGGTGADVSGRVYEFQGQSPLYYYVPWLSVQLFGTSELALRLPSLLFVVLASALTGCAAAQWYGLRAGLQATLFVCCLPPVLTAALGARPYSLALTGYACAWLGYARAVDGKRWGRLLFVAGGALLFWAHYLLAVFLVGFLAAHVLVRALRVTYGLRSMIFDSALILLLSLPGLPHLHRLWLRRDGLDWMPAPDILAWVPLLLPALLTVTLALAVRARAILKNSRVTGAGVAVVTPLALIYLASHLGPNLIEERYLIPTALGGALLAAGAISTLSLRVTRVGVVLFVAAALVVPAAFRSLAVGRSQDWASVRRNLDAAVARDPEVLILYRSGFVEQDAAQSYHLLPVDAAPLAPPGFPAFRSRVIPLTYTWTGHVTDRLSADVLPALRAGRTVYFVSPQDYTSKTGPYGDMLSHWITQRQTTVRRHVLRCCDGVQMIRFETGN